MLFWKKDTAKEIRDDLDSIERRTEQLERFEDQVDTTHTIVKKIKNNIENAIKDMKARAEEQKAKPWIDQRFDSEIDQTAEIEIGRLRKLKQDLGFYEELVKTAKNKTELDDLIKALKKEEEMIVERDKNNKEKVEEIERETLRERLSRHSDTPPNKNTKDGVPMSNIAAVTREFGGYVDCSRGQHSCHLVFPNHTRTIPLSADKAARGLANQIRKQLNNFLPAHKLPNTHNIRLAIQAGNIRRAA